MLDGMEKFVNCFRHMEDLEDAIKELYPSMRVSLQRRIFLLGESAGDYWAAVILWLQNDLNVASCELYYPMAGHYEREAGYYRGYAPSHQDLVESALEWVKDGTASRLNDHPGQARTTPLGMGSIALTATWTRAKCGDDIRHESMWTVLGGNRSFLELLNVIKKDVKISRRVKVLPDLVIEPSTIFQRLGNKLSSINLRYLPDCDALEYIRPTNLPKVVKPRLPLTVVVIQGTTDVNTPQENLEELVEGFKWAGADVIYEKIEGAPHAFDVPTVQSEQGQHYNVASSTFSRSKKDGRTADPGAVLFTEHGAQGKPRSHE
ncbi:hypothetical protein PMIN04_011606 [Paraphaeosphaeria minitans]